MGATILECAKFARAGRFRDAARVAAKVADDTPQSAVLRLELDYFVGNLRALDETVEALLRTVKETSLRSRIVAVGASIRWDLGDLADSLVLSAKALDLARAASDGILACRAAVCLM
jgi:hypothetical protein